jgi:hypothetical protein
MQEQEQITTLPGVFATIAAGFDLTAKHLWLLILPVILDVFYWLGPRLRFQNLIEQVLALLPEEADLLDLGTQLAQVAPRTNLFTTLTVQLIGVPALMVGQVPDKTPISTQVVEIGTWLSWLGLFVAFSIVGLLLTAILYSLIAYVISKQTPDGKILNAGQWAKGVGSSWLRLMGLVLFFLLIVFIIYIPLITISTILFMINGALGSIVLLVGPFILIWVTIFLFLAPYGIVLNRRPVLRAVFESVRLVQTNLPSALLLMLAVLLTGSLLDWLLYAVDNGTWLTLINIVGHAFVSTALIAAMFIFYRDRYAALFEPKLAIMNQSPLENNQ